MTTNSKRARVMVLLSNDAEATETNVDEYLSIASDMILDKLYPFGRDDEVAFPPKYDALQCEVAAWLFSRRGALGETTHNENGINRTYGSADGCELLSRVTPFASVR